MKSIFSSIALMTFFGLILFFYLEIKSRTTSTLPPTTNTAPRNSFATDTKHLNTENAKPVATSLEMPALKIIRMEGILSRDASGQKFYRDIDSNTYWFASVKDSLPEDFGKLSEYEGWVSEIGTIKFFTATVKTR